jgi:hypothetical protein
LAVVQPATLIRWHRQGFRLFWQWKSCPGRPPIPADLQVLIRRMACDNPSWGEEQIANELLLKLGLRMSPRTVRKYLPKRLDHGRGKGVPSQRWRTFVRNHAQAIIACDFCVVVTTTFRLLYVFVLMEHARDTAHPPRQCHGAPHGLMDAAATARSNSVGPSVPLPDPRPGQHLLTRTRPAPMQPEPAGAETPGADAAGQRHL